MAVVVTYLVAVEIDSEFIQTQEGDELTQVRSETPKGTGDESGWG